MRGEGRVSHTSAQLNHIKDVKKKEDRRNHMNLYIARNPGRYCHMKHQFDKINYCLLILFHRAKVREKTA